MTEKWVTKKRMFREKEICEAPKSPEKKKLPMVQPLLWCTLEETNAGVRLVISIWKIFDLKILSFFLKHPVDRISTELNEAWK